MCDLSDIGAFSLITTRFNSNGSSQLPAQVDGVIGLESSSDLNSLPQIVNISQRARSYSTLGSP
jgi:hypothetical protein